MSDAQKAALSPEVVLEQMKKNGVTHVVWLPDSETNWLYLLMKADPSLTLVGVNREGLAFSRLRHLRRGQNAAHPDPEHRAHGFRRLDARLGDAA